MTTYEWTGPVRPERLPSWRGRDRVPDGFSRGDPPITFVNLERQEDSAPAYRWAPPKDVTNVKTYFPKEIENDWVVIDAAGQTVGRLATQVAQLLRGKHKPTYTPHMAGGDFVIIVNAEKVVFSGSKLDQKIYTRYSGYQGGLKEIPARAMLAKHPERVLERAVWGMLPKNRLGRKLIRRLKVYAGETHPHHAQQPKALEVR